MIGRRAGALALAGALVGACARPGGGPAAAVPTEAPVPAELVLEGAAIYTLDPAAPWAEALAVADGTLVAVGPRDAVMRHRGPRTRVVDLHGQLVLPGFHDTHVHPVTGGIELGQCDLNGITDLDALRTALRACAAAQADRPWLVGGGWDLTLFAGGNPGRAWLDAVVPDVPVFLSSADGHSAWLNGEGLRRAGITASTPDPPNGRIERDAGGAPSGTLREDAMALAVRHLPPLTAAEHEAGLRRGLALAGRFGIVGLHEASASPPVLAAYEALARDGELTARVVVAQTVDVLRGPEQLDAIVARGRQAAHPRLRAATIKIFVDGVIEAGTAALLEPYLDASGSPTASAGEPALSPAALEALVVRADALGLDVHVHAIGDRAIRMSLDAFEAARRDNPPRDRRHVIAHLELVDPADLPRFRALGVAACVQPLWAQADSYVTALTVPVLGPARSRWLYPLGSLLAAGAFVTAGSDWSVSSMDPLDGLEVALTRRAVGEPPGPAWIPEEVVALAPMLEAYTLHGAWLGRWDAVSGSLVAGKRADLVVLDGNVLELPAHRLHEAEVVTTMLDGQVVWRGEGDRVGGA